MDLITVEMRLRSALEALLHNDPSLLKYDASKWSICGRLAIYLQGVFPSHDVDMEYDRHATDPERLSSLGGCGVEDDEVVVPDVIVHRRDDDQRNLLVIELKTSTSSTPRECDVAKLTGFVEEFGYRFAVLVELPPADAPGRHPEFEWIAAGMS